MVEKRACGRPVLSLGISDKIPIMQIPLQIAPHCAGLGGLCLGLYSELNGPVDLPLF